MKAMSALISFSTSVPNGETMELIRGLQRAASHDHRHAGVKRQVGCDIQRIGDDGDIRHVLREVMDKGGKGRASIHDDRGAVRDHLGRSRGDPILLGTLQRGGQLDGPSRTGST